MAAIAVESEDPIRSADRAQHLLAPLLPRERGPARRTCRPSPRPTARRCSSAAPTPTPSWLTDFLTAGRPAAARTRRHRHRPRRAVAAVRLLRRGGALLPLGARARAADSRELAAPDGLVRSRAARSADGSVRFALNVPRWSATTASGVPARRARQRRRPRRSRGDARRAASRCSRSPTTTTTTCRARRARPGDARDACASSACSTTRRATASCCTSTPRWSAAGLFFEIVERRGGYDGYGAANSPVRVAAQRAPVVSAESTEQPRRRAVSATPSPIHRDAA